MSKTKVALVYPVPSVSSPQKSPPLSILHLSRALAEAKVRGKSDEEYDVRCWDLRYDDMTPEDFKWADVVGVSSMTGHQIRGAIWALKEAKKYGKRTILGGIHVTMRPPEESLREDFIDSIVLSEGEWGIIDAIHGGPKQVVHKHLTGTQDHVSPVSPETLIHFKRSARTGDTVLMTSRGCPFRCGFCYIQQFFERNERGALAWQEVDMDRWRHDVLYLKENAGVRKYEHGDDWIGKWSRAKEIIRFLWDNGIEYRPSIRAHQINDEVAREMAEIGVKHVSIGMETASLRMLKLTQKDILPHHQIECAEALAKYHIHPLLYWILSFPTETKAEMNETLDQIDKMAEIFKKHGTPLTQNAFSYTALPGSPMFDLVDQSVLPKTMEGWSNYSINKTHDTISSNLYWLVGLTFHRAKGDKTARNFPGWKRLLIAPFETLAVIRWKLRFFKWFRLEMWAIETLMKWASLRYENEVRRGKFKSLKDVEAMDFGVKENHPDVGARGEFLTGEIAGKR